MSNVKIFCLTYHGFKQQVQSMRTLIIHSLKLRYGIGMAKKIQFKQFSLLSLASPCEDWIDGVLLAGRPSLSVVHVVGSLIGDSDC